MSKIYVCTGSCGGQAMEPGVCQTDQCERKGQPLQAMMKCDHCGAIYPEGETHSCA